MTMLELRLQKSRTKAGRQAVRQGNVVPAQDDQVHGGQELFQTEAAVHRDVGQLPDLSQLGDRQA